MHQKRSKPGMFLSSFLLKWANITPINFPIFLSMLKEGLPALEELALVSFSTGEVGGEGSIREPVLVSLVLWTPETRLSPSQKSSLPLSPDSSGVYAKKFCLANLSAIGQQVLGYVLCPLARKGNEDPQSSQAKTRHQGQGPPTQGPSQGPGPPALLCTRGKMPKQILAINCLFLASTCSAFHSDLIASVSSCLSLGAGKGGLSLALELASGRAKAPSSCLWD